MKKFIMMLLCAIFIIGASIKTNAQMQMTPVLDTNTNGATTYIYTAIQAGNLGSYAFQYVGTKLSGTVAGKVYLQGTIDGVNYQRMGGDDSLTLADQAVNTRIWDINNQKRVRYRLAITTTGTVVLTNKGYFTERR